MTDEKTNGRGRDDIPTSSPAVLDYQLVLTGVIEQVQNDPSRLRALVYELARINLKREAFASYPTIKRAGAERQLAELERAIERVEANAETETATAFLPALVERPEPARQAPAMIDSEQPPRWLDSRVRVSPEPIDYRSPRQEQGRGTSRVNSVLQFIGTAAIGILLFAILTGQITFDQFLRPRTAAPAAPIATKADLAGRQAEILQPPLLPPAASRSPFPLPTTYGVYVVSEGRLYELEALPIKVPDQRIQVSAEINSPSITTVSGENIVFVIFRRELVHSAPQKVQVRVVARVTREMTFRGGPAATANVDGAWHIRPHAYDFKVAPIENRHEIIAIQPDAGFVLPPGRYVLVLNGVGYDFTVAGAITPPAQCLERFESVNGPMYAECQTP